MPDSSGAFCSWLPAAEKSACARVLTPFSRATIWLSCVCAMVKYGTAAAQPQLPVNHVQQAASGGLTGSLSAAAHAELAQDRRDVMVDGLLRHVEAAGDLGVRRTVAQQLEDLDLAGSGRPGGPWSAAGPRAAGRARRARAACGRPR